MIPDIEDNMLNTEPGLFRDPDVARYNHVTDLTFLESNHQICSNLSVCTGDEDILHDEEIVAADIFLLNSLL